MIITAGMGTIDDFETLIDAGADEIFCGFVPLEWNLKYGNVLPLNRREVIYYHTQITTYEDMQILYNMAVSKNIRVSVTFNALYYAPGQMGDVISIIEKLNKIGFKDYIIADINLLRAIKEHKLNCNIHLSGEVGEWNRYSLMYLMREFSNEFTAITRIIFHRKNTVADIELIIKQMKESGFELEYEAFCMNEKCHYTGGFCNSLHCDELVHMCMLDYRVPRIELKGYDEADEEYIPGSSGCALCALDKLEKSGVTHLKIVGRGQSASLVAQDIMAVRHNAGSKFKRVCNKNCYYPE